MDVTQALLQRKSTRAFLDTPVSRDTVTRLVSLARQAPSGANTQPWQVAVVSGITKQQLQARLESAFRAGESSKMQYHYYPVEWKPLYKERRVACGLQLYQAVNIKRDDKQRRLEQWIANYRAFDAPVLLLFFMDASLEKGSFMDYGMFLQSLMLAAVEQGLATCPQAALGEYPEIVREVIGFPDDTILLCGMALGYEDVNAPINHYRTPREPVEDFTRFFD